MKIMSHRFAIAVVTFIFAVALSWIDVISANNCRSSNCDDDCAVNNSFCTSTTAGYFYSQGKANTDCHPKDANNGGTPDTQKNVSKTTRTGGSCQTACYLDGFDQVGNPVSGTATTTTVAINTVCKKTK